MQEGTMKKLSNLNETTPPWDVFNSLCPTRQVLNRIADKWSVLIIRQLSDGTLRFSQLRRAISGISQKALTSTLRGLERDGIVNRRLYASVPPRVDYSLTELGRSLVKLVAGICSWAEAHIEDVQEARQAFDAIDHTGIIVESIAPSARVRGSRRKL
jgi:DNA-binding HxlR family transcriptional regulator